MKKNILLFLFIITILFVFSYRQSNDKYKVYKIETPTKIFIDSNKNLIFDDINPYIVSNVISINRSSDLKEFPILKNLTSDEKLFLEYKANELAKRLLENKFIYIKDNEIIVKNQKYSKILLDSKFVFNKNEKTQIELIKNLKSYNLDEFFIFNKRTKKYYKFNSKDRISAQNFKLIHISQIPQSILLNEIKQQNEPQEIIIKKPIDTFEINNIKIFFQDLNTIYKPNNRCDTKACKTLKKEIENSKQSIDFAVYGINNQPEILNALIHAQNRGVKIRWVCDFDKRNNNYYPDLDFLKNKIKSFTTDENYDKLNTPAIMHNKFFIFDNKKVWTGSSNITGTDLTEFNANYSILITSNKIAEQYKNEFEQMYNGFFHTDKQKQNKDIVVPDNNTKIKVLFSPQDKIIDNEIITIIQKAKKSIYIPIFFITHKEIKDELIKAHKRGIDIKVINDATNAHSKYTIHKELRKSGIKVKTENYAGKMHMKAMFVDGRISIIGSMNFTKSANNKNDENVLIIDNEEIAKFFEKTFIYLWEKIPSKYEHFDPRAESLESIGSCYDGIDNNFDNRIDSEDVGCIIKN